MPPKGSKLSEESKQKIRNARRLQKSPIIGRYGVTEQAYNEAKEKGLKWCRTCKHFLPPHEFYGEDNRCIACLKSQMARWRKKRVYRRTMKEYAKRWRDKHPEETTRHWLAKYGVTISWYEARLAEQDGKCAICRKPPGERRLCVDHCHKSDAVRGLLCIRCNSFISGIEDGLLQPSLAYLRTHNPEFLENQCPRSPSI